MLGRALVWATVMLGLTVAVPAGAQNLEAGKAPSQIFSGTCALCHKSPRGLLKSVPPGSLSGFLRQHYTTSTDMAAAMSAYVLSNGAASPVASGNLRRGQEARSGGPAAEPGPERAAKGRKHAREAAKPETDGQPQAVAGGEGASHPAGPKQKAAKAKAKAARSEPPPKIEARHESAKDEPAKTEPAKTEEPAAGETAKVEGTRPDPVPAVTPAPKEPDAKEKAKENAKEDAREKASDLAAVTPAAEAKEPAEAKAATDVKDVKEVELPSGPLTIEIGPAPAPKAPVAAVASAPPVPPAGPPAPPISH